MPTILRDDDFQRLSALADGKSIKLSAYLSTVIKQHVDSEGTPC